MLKRFLLRFPFYQRHIQKKLQKQSKFYQQNRINVLTTYRHLIKMIPKIYPRALQQAQKLNQIRWIYKNSKQLPNIYETEGRTNLALRILNEIRKGDFTSLGDLVPHRYPRIYRSTNQFLNAGSPKSRKWYRGGIY